MSNEAPKVDPKYYKSSAASPKLVREALKPFRIMLWLGIAAIALGLIALALGNPYLIDSMLMLAIPFFAGAGVVAGLGRREVVETT